MKLLLIFACIAFASARPKIGQHPSRYLKDGARDDLPDVYMDTPELIKYYGYPVEEHQVKTEDGYLLTMHRIPHGKGEEPRTGRPVVFLQHGLFCSSSDWVIMGPGKGFAYILADVGYDVWMGNARGNHYSRAHATLSPDDSEYWQFTWNEMGKYDLPAEIDHVLSQTGEEKVFYVGHSMGTTMFYVMGSLRPEYNAKIRAQFSLAPVAFMSNLQTPLKILAPFVNQIEWVAKFFGIDEFLPNSDLLDMVGAALCKDEAITQSLCSNILFLLCGYDSQQLNETMIPVIIGHVPAGASSKTVIHYGQEVNSAKFQQYDYGKDENLKIYGQETPPDYDLSLVTAPVYLHYAENDYLSAVEELLTRPVSLHDNFTWKHHQDVNDLASKLPNLQEKIDIPDDKFNHLDFLWAIDVKTLVYDKIMSVMDSYLK